MIRNILTAQQHNARSPRELDERHTMFLRKLRARGFDVLVHDESTPVTARIDHGQWLFDCVCGSGVLTHPAWKVGRCFGCGAVYTGVIFPEDGDRAEIETVLTARPRLANRNWFPWETVQALRDENVLHDVREER